MHSQPFTDGNFCVANLPCVGSAVQTALQPVLSEQWNGAPLSRYLISTAAEIWDWCQDGIDASLCSQLVLKNVNNRNELVSFFNTVMTCVIIIIIIIIDISCAVQLVNILLILSYLLFTCPSSSPPCRCREYYKLCIPLLHCLNTRAEPDFYMLSFDVSGGWTFDQPVRCSLIKMKLWDLSAVPGVCWAMTLYNLVDTNNKPPSWMVNLFQNFPVQSSSAKVKYILCICTSFI